MVPVDDEHHQRFEVYFGKATREEADRYMERFKNLERVPELGDAVLAGSLQLGAIDDWARSRVQIEDYLVLVGQGAIPDRGREHLGRSDVLVVLRRKIWERELKALAEGRPLKNWKRPERLQTSFNRL
jgi:5,5'-dehydrodivanillate O-demethylase